MSQKKRVKSKKVPPQKALQDLAANDYMEPNDEAYSDSDILAGQGVDVRHSNAETREEKAQMTLAERERREQEEQSSPPPRPRQPSRPDPLAESRA